MKVRCSDCQNPEELITNQGRRFYCKVKGIWIPERKYDRKRKCGRFEPLKQTAAI